MTRIDRGFLPRSNSSSKGWRCKSLGLGLIGELESVSISKGAARLAAGQGTAPLVRKSARLGTRRSARSEVGCEMWRDEARRGRAGQAFNFCSGRAACAGGALWP
jgi:hypothetical protein